MARMNRPLKSHSSLVINSALSIISITSVIALGFLLSACAPNNKLQSQKATPQTEPQKVEQELKSTTLDYESLSEHEVEQYEKPAQVIQSGKNNIYIGYTKYKNIKSIYNKETRELEITGTIELLANDKKTITQTKDFSLKGIHKKTSTVFPLKPSESLILAKPVSGASESTELQVRAKVTCLSIDEAGNVDCTDSIVDFFAKSGKNYFTEQMQTFAKQTGSAATTAAASKTVQTPTANESMEVPPAITSVEQTAETTTSDTATVEDEAEGDDESLPGRYEGTVLTTSLDQLFSVEDDSSDDAADITANFKKLADGRIVMTNQAFGSPNRGLLKNASNLKSQQETLKQQDLYTIVTPANRTYFGTQEMMDIIVGIGSKMKMMERNRIFISRISAQKGGKLPPSKSHQIGVDVDLGYPTFSGKTAFPVVVAAGGSRVNKTDYSASKTLELFKFLIQQNITPIAKIFIDRNIIADLCQEAKKSGQTAGADKEIVKKVFNSLQHVDGHGNHFHLRIQCTANQPHCTPRIYKVGSTCS